MPRRKRPSTGAPVNAGYFSQPTLAGSLVVFVSEDDLWSVSASGGIAHRLTTSLSRVARPRLSPDGAWIAFRGQDDGPQEVCLMPAWGGETRRLTYLGSRVAVAGWDPQGRVIFASDAHQPHDGLTQLYALDVPEGGQPRPLPYAMANAISFAPGGGQRLVIGRFTSDTARWKRYRGGMQGVLWADPTGQGRLKKLLPAHRGNITDPMWIRDRVFFLSDADGVANLYSCTPEGKELSQHSFSEDYYLRHAASDGKRIVYQKAADLYLYDPARDSHRKLRIEFPSARAQRNRRYVRAGSYIEDYDLHPAGHSLSLNARGQSFYFNHWEGAVRQLERRPAARYRLTRWLQDERRLVTVSDQGGEEAIEIHEAGTGKMLERLDHLHLGRIREILVNPDKDLPLLAVTNHRNELHLVDLRDNRDYPLVDSAHGAIDGLDWSHDGRWLVYSLPVDRASSRLYLFSLAAGKSHPLTDGRFWDFQPSFDPEGKYIYFLSLRDFRPLYDNLYFDLSFPYPVLPCLITLQADTPSPFKDQPKSFLPKPSASGKVDAELISELDPDDLPREEPSSRKSSPLGDSPPASKKSAAKTKSTDSDPEAATDDEEDDSLAIDLDGIQHRVLSFPVAQKNYVDIRGVKKGVLLHSVPQYPSYGKRWSSSRNLPETGELDFWHFKKMRLDNAFHHVGSLFVHRARETIIYTQGKHLRVATIDQALGDTKFEDAGARHDGWIALSRVKVAVQPADEWSQMLREVWRLQRDEFWTDKFPVDWEEIYQRYAPLIDKVGARSELSDLIWEMQGELGTSHAYEMGGDYRASPYYEQGRLAADYEWDEDAGAYRITHIVRGDSWEPGGDSPLHAPGVNVHPGDFLVAVNGEKLTPRLHPDHALVHLAGLEVDLSILPAGSPEENSPEKFRHVTVTALRDDTHARYREWVETNRAYIDEKTGGRAGYLHIPNMGAAGFAEFHRYYAKEVEREGLIIDVRFNGGGHVSQLLLEKLARKRIGYVYTRHSSPYTYPQNAPRGPVIAICNEMAGSDGDIFTHAFKMLGLGPVVGRRTWGGVVGMSPSRYLIDGSLATQPGHHYWFDDLGGKLENRGVTPDVNVEVDPIRLARSQADRSPDAQLQRALKLLLEELP